MKNILLFFLIALLMDGVFGESVSVSVREGDSVTLHTGLSEIQEKDVIQWRFKTDLIAQFNTVNKKISLYDDVLDGRFKDRLKLDSQTGDLTIRNIRTEHAGDYEVKNLNTLKTSFRVSVVSAVVPPAAVKSVMEGDSVTLQTDLTDIQRDVVIQWRFGQQKSPVAKINRAAGIFNTFDVLDERFRGRLKLDNQTGSLNITDTRTTDSGTYEAEISSSRSRYTIHHTQSFIVTVSADVVSVSVKKGGSVTLHTGLTGIQGTDQILWKFGDDDLNGPVNKKWNNTDLNPQTGDLTISNIQTDQYGDYEVEINTRTIILHRKYRIIESGWSSAAVARIGVGVGVVCFLLGAAVGAGVIYYCYKKSKVIRQNHALNGTQNPDDRVNEGTELTNAP